MSKVRVWVTKNARHAREQFQKDRKRFSLIITLTKSCVTAAITRSKNRIFPDKETMSIKHICLKCKRANVLAYDEYCQSCFLDGVLSCSFDEFLNLVPWNETISKRSSLKEVHVRFKNFWSGKTSNHGRWFIDSINEARKRLFGQRNFVGFLGHGEMARRKNQSPLERSLFRNRWVLRPIQKRIGVASMVQRHL